MHQQQESRRNNRKKDDIHTIRRPLCYYFSQDPAALCEEIDWCRRYELPTKIADTSPSSLPPRNPPMVVVPHGAYCDSGPLVAHAFQQHIVPNQPTLVLFIGTEHASASPHLISCSPHALWQTPLGNVSCHTVPVYVGIPADATAFLEEHSVENQLPFLQVLLQNHPWKMMALSVRGNVQPQDLPDIKAAGQRLATWIVEQQNDHHNNTRIAIVASTDYTHAGPGYGELPTQVGQSIPDYIRARDLAFLQLLCHSGDDDSQHLPSIEQVWRRGGQSSMCGLGALLLTLEIGRNLGRTHVRLIRYAVGSDICNRGVQDQTGFATLVLE